MSNAGSFYFSDFLLIAGALLFIALLVWATKQVIFSRRRVVRICASIYLLAILLFAVYLLVDVFHPFGKPYVLRVLHSAHTPGGTDLVLTQTYLGRMIEPYELFLWYKPKSKDRWGAQPLGDVYYWWRSGEIVINEKTKIFTIKEGNQVVREFQLGDFEKEPLGYLSSPSEKVAVWMPRAWEPKEGNTYKEEYRDHADREYSKIGYQSQLESEQD